MKDPILEVTLELNFGLFPYAAGPKAMSNLKKAWALFLTRGENNKKVFKRFKIILTVH